MGARARMGQPEEELEVELPPEDKENKEDLFIPKVWKMTGAGITFKKCKN